MARKKKDKKKKGETPSFNVDDIMSDVSNILSKKFGSKIKKEVSVPIKDFISTGNPLVDWSLGKGLPLGKIIEIWGEEGTGKSTLAYQILGKIYKKGGIIVLFDTENSFDPIRGKQFGIENIILENPETVEEAFDMLHHTIENLKDRGFGVVVWDSLAATPTEADIKGNAGIGSKARVVSDRLQKVLKGLEQSNLSLVIINQARSKIDTGFSARFGGQRITAPSARALRHDAIIRAHMKVVGKIKVDNYIVGHVVEFTPEKNKIAPPFRSVRLHLLFKSGFSLRNTIIENAIQLGVIKRHGAYYDYNDIRYQGKTAIIKEMSKEDLKKLIKEVIKALEEVYENVWEKITTENV